MKSLVNEINKTLGFSAAEEVLAYCARKFNKKVVFSTSLGAEDQVITHMLSGMDVRIITLDTGRLFQETLDLIQYTNSRYKINIEVFFPDFRKVESMVNEKGINLFYESIENRKMCCDVRKIQPLKRALKGMDVWITGIRRTQSMSRENSQLAEWDEQNKIIKVNPLISWSEEQVWDYIRLHKIPYNILHDKGFPSIGCAPCTRAIEKGEDIRNGRWWWENTGSKECGLHK